MCIHINKGHDQHFDTIIASIEALDDRELDQLQALINRRRSALRQSTVLERRGYRHGILQLESRTYRRKDGEQTERGPYWYFHYRQGGRQRTLYVGKTDSPEIVLDEKIGKE
ncbi:MAG: hypothetical protein JOZ19_16270 [Rubrobacter sp.]|nr:hypothetical protein [Rubrobacter sp.]